MKFFSRWLLRAAYCGWMLLCLDAKSGETDSWIHIHGNAVLIDETYRAILDLPPEAKADPTTAKLVRKQILKFLRKAGYEMATVKVKVEEDVIDLNVDEGRLDKIVFFGLGTLKTLQLKLDLSLPHHVFNRPFLERQLGILGRKYGLGKVWYKLVPVKQISHVGPQLEDLGDIQGLPVLPPGSRVELQIHLGNDEWDLGLGVDLTYDFPDGLELGVGYKGEGMVFSADRWQTGGSLGGKLRKKIESGDAYVALSHVVLEARWYTPPLIGKGFRPFLWLQSDLVSRQRQDLQVEIFYRERVDATLNLGLEFVRGWMLSLGGGVEEKLLFGMERTGDNPPPLDEGGSWLRPFVLGRNDLVFNVREPRRDRRHVFTLESRYYWVNPGHPYGRGNYQYQKIFALGWHDLVVRSRGTWLWGVIPFDEEEPVGGRYVRGCFDDKYYVNKVGNLSFEFRFSLARDLFKVSIFHDLAFFANQDRATNPPKEKLGVANSFGLGFHALILDVIQADLYYAFGFSNDKDFDNGLAASLTKVF
jgi:hypothetical protein